MRRRIKRTRRRVDSVSGKTGVVIRPQHEEDVEADARVVRDIADEEDWILTPPGTPLADLVKRFREANADPERVTLVVDADGVIVGGGTIAPMGPRKEHVADLGMGIAASHRGLGIGGRLLDALLEASRERGFEKVHLTVWGTNARARRLYESRGFVVEGVLRGQLKIRGRPVDEVVMALWLDQSGGRFPVRTS